MKLSAEDLEEIERYVAALAAAHCDERVSRREFEREISAMIVFAADDYRYLASRAREMADHFQKIGRES
jgi:NurA-like 5'-3' nuclease